MKKCFIYQIFLNFKLFSENRLTEVKFWAKGNKCFLKSKVHHKNVI